MGAKPILRAPVAVKIVAGALVPSMAAAALALGSASAVARGAQGAQRTAPEAPTADAAAVWQHHRLKRDRRSLRASRFVVERGAMVGHAGSVVTVHGLLTPGRRGAWVRLVARTGRSWRTLAIARTHRNGRFRIVYRVQGVGATSVRVAFAGTRRARAASAAAGQIVALAPTVASWYDDGGNTACGFHATYGVANRTLPCGTKVTLSYGDRTVVATVDDRGPYVYGRSFDLNQNTARYLGMWGVAQVFASV